MSGRCLGAKIRKAVAVLIGPAALLLALGPPGGAGVEARPAADDFNIRTVPPGLVEQIEGEPALLGAVGKTNWELLLRVSRQVAEEGLSAIAESAYMPRPAQRELFRAVRRSPAIPEDVRLVLQDLIVQYYVFTYYYDAADAREREFRGEDLSFLQGLGIEYVWIEPAAQNYYQHTFLKELVRTLPDSRWGMFYRPIFAETGFREVPREGEGEAERGVPEGRALRLTVAIEGEVREGQDFEAYFGPGFRLRLEPRPLGWEIIVRYLIGADNVARLTPPLHAVPNPRDLEGWHFRNSDNTGANEPGEKNVNAPGEEREFIFSPDVGIAIQSPETRRSPTEKEIERVRAFGQGLLRIVDYRLGNLKPGEQAKFEWLRFEVRLSWPAAYTP